MTHPATAAAGIVVLMCSLVAYGAYASTTTVGNQFIGLFVASLVFIAFVAPSFFQS